MKKLLDKIAAFIEMSYSAGALRLDQPVRESDLVELREMYARKNK